jgi:hypothetical protein
VSRSSSTSGGSTRVRAATSSIASGTPSRRRQISATVAVAAVFMRGYIAEMGEHPQTIGYPLLDSPLGLAAWTLDHDADAYEKISRAFLDGQPSGNP